MSIHFRFLLGCWREFQSHSLGSPVVTSYLTSRLIRHTYLCKLMLTLIAQTHAKHRPNAPPAPGPFLPVGSVPSCHDLSPAVDFKLEVSSHLAFIFVARSSAGGSILDLFLAFLTILINDGGGARSMPIRRRDHGREATRRRGPRRN